MTKVDLTADGDALLMYLYKTREAPVTISEIRKALGWPIDRLQLAYNELYAHNFVTTCPVVN
jgi:hypothetical protein